MLVAPQLEILDLRHFSARQLRPLLETEARIWFDRLRWNYDSSTELVLQYLDSRVLPGFVALDRGRVCGFTFCVYEANKAVIGDAFAFDPQGGRELEITSTLLKHLLEVLQYSPATTRVESQLLLYDAGVLVPLFAGQGFAVYPRLFMECSLPRSRTATVAAPPLDRSIQMRPWAAADYQDAAELIHASYSGHVDARINDQYRTLHGSLRFLHNIVRFPGCGVFDPGQSWVLRDRKNGRLAGMLLCSRVANDVVHITQLCVGPSYRGGLLGQLLLAQSMESLRRSAYSAITLTVTEENRRAVGLYEAVGFFARHRFDAMVLEKNGAA